MAISVPISYFNKSLFLFPYFLMIFVGLMMPSDGNHGIFTPKSLSFLGSLFFFSSYIFVKQKANVEQLKIFFFTVCMTGFLAIWLFFGLNEDPVNSAPSFDQFKVFIITIAFVVMTLYAVSESLVLPETIIKAMIFSNFSYSFLKLSLILLHILGFIDLFSFMESIDMRFMSMEMAAGVSRFQTSADIVTPFFMFFVLQSNQLNLNFSKSFKCIYILVSIISILFSFSRFLMMVGCLSCFLYWLTLNAKGFLKGLGVFILLICAFVAVVGLENVYLMIESRFLGNASYYSDLTRKEQIDALMEQFFKTPYLGMGLGGHVKDLVRDGEILHSYEVQWVAFLMQFGMIGLSLLLVPMCIISYQFLKKPFSRVHLAFFFLFLTWLLSGFTNPFLISLASGIMYSIFLLGAKVLNRNF